MDTVGATREPSAAQKSANRLNDRSAYVNAVLGLIAIVMLLAFEVDAKLFGFMLTCVTIPTFVAMWFAAEKRKRAPEPDGRNGRRIVRGVVLMAMVLVATVLAYQQWGALAGGLGCVVLYGAIWLPARQVPAALKAKRERSVTPAA